MTLALTWLEFALLAMAIGGGGYYLSVFGDVIAQRTGLGGTWVGLALLATVTSLPELVTGVSAVTAAQAPDIAVGDALGSCIFNLLLIVILDLLHRSESVYTRASHGHILSAGFGIVLLGFVALNLLVSQVMLWPVIFHIGWYTPVIFTVYIAAVRAVFAYERRQLAVSTLPIASPERSMTLKAAVRGYLVAATVVVAAGSWMPFVGKTIAELMGWHQTLVGTLFVALATSLPELAVTISALRIGALDMAIADLLGSNLFDILILGIDDLVYLPGSLLRHVSALNTVTALSAMMMSGVAIVGLLYRDRSRLFRTVGWTSLVLVSVYLLNATVLYLARG